MIKRTRQGSYVEAQEGEVPLPTMADARNMVGDGKTPNFYWVFGDAGYYRLEQQPDGSKHLTPVNEEEAEYSGRDIGVFRTFREAVDALEGADIGPPDVSTGLHRGFIEDRLTGVVYEMYYVESVEPTYELEINDDSRFAREQLGEAFE